MSLLHGSPTDGAELAVVIVFNSDILSGSETVVFSVISGGGFESERPEELETLQPS